MKALTTKASFDWTPNSYILTITPSLIDKFHFPFVQEMGDLQANATYYAEREKLPSYLLVYTVAGHGYLTYENRQYSLWAGDVFLIDCMKFQHYETDPDQLWHLRFVHFFGGTSEQYYKTFRAESDSVVHLPPASRLPVYLDRLLADYQPATRNSDLLAAMYLAQMLTELILNNRTAAPDHWQDYAREIAQYIDDHFAEELTLDSLARRFSLSKTYLPKKFKAQYGISPTEYLACIRIKKAKEYLHDTDYPVCKVAEMVGIDNPSYFIKLFKRHEKLTPYAYHSKWKSIYPDRGGRAL